jgi:hypothetical protein
MPRLKFSTYRPAVNEPIEIELNDDDVFHFKPGMTGIDLLDTLEAIDSPSNAVAAKAVKDLFNDTLISDPAEFPDHEIPEDNVKAFWAYIRNKDNHIDLPKLQEIANGLVEEIAGGRPTQSSQQSSDGSATNGSGSTPRPSEKAGPSRRSRSKS